MFEQLVNTVGGVAKLGVVNAHDFRADTDFISFGVTGGKKANRVKVELTNNTFTVTSYYICATKRKLVKLNTVYNISATALLDEIISAAKL